MLFRLGCELGYWTSAPTPFVFNIEAQSFGGQIVEEEQLTITPHVEPDRWTMPESGNRYFRVNAPAGALKLEYTALVRWEPTLEDPELVTEMALSQLPLSVFIHLYPSRYCQSDKLERFARSTFGKLDPGYARVNGVCNWIHDYVSYEGGSSDALTSAFDTVTQRAPASAGISPISPSPCAVRSAFRRGTRASTRRNSTRRISTPSSKPTCKGRRVAAGTFSIRRASPIRPASSGSVSDAMRRKVAFCSPYGATDFSKPEVWIRSVEAPAETTTRAVRSQSAA